MAPTKAQLRKVARKTIKAMQAMKTEKPVHKPCDKGLLWIHFLKRRAQDRGASPM
jgi:hypothetical protein